jgi:hypothetical protein
MNLDDLIYQGEIPKLYPEIFTDNQWAWTYRNRENNGLSKITVILNGKGYLIKPKLPDWLETRIESNLKPRS